jgi:hypothetical protein
MELRLYGKHPKKTGCQQGYYTPSRKVERQVKVLSKYFAIFFLCTVQQAVSADIIPNSAFGIFFPKT